jgi:F0F1-type ATP synthase membrane subunit c/vacuolar-type H+-ATPase subunit K
MRRIFPLCVTVFAIMYLVSRVFAQQPAGIHIAQTLGVTDPQAIEGDIVSLTQTPGQLELSKVLGDSRMYGVLQEEPLVVYKTTDDIPVVSAGEVLVNVTTLGGPILTGDFITSSEIPGKGQKAEQGMRGYMLGHAMTSFGEEDGEVFDYQGKQLRRGQIRVLLNIRPISFTGGNILATLQQTQAASLDVIKDQKSRDRYFRYLIAVLIVLGAIYFSYRTFGRNVTKGIEGIGRNPLAKASIQAMIVLNMILIGIVCIGGMILALLVISL